MYFNLAKVTENSTETYMRLYTRNKTKRRKKNRGKRSLLSIYWNTIIRLKLACLTAIRKATASGI